MSIEADLILRFGETKLPITADLTDTIAAAGFTLPTDIIAATFMLKSDPTALDAAAEYTGTLAGGQIDISPASIFTAVIDDFTNLAVGVDYFLGIGLQFTGDTEFRELDVRLERGKLVETVAFSQDVIRA